MALRSPTSGLHLAPLRDAEPGGLAALLEEETRKWAEFLHWDFRPSAELVRRYAGMRSLDGFVLLAGPETIGYVYMVSEEHKGLIGDLYVRQTWRSAIAEEMLLHAALNELARSPYVRRVEAQLMLLESLGRKRLDGVGSAKVYPRLFLSIVLGPRPAIRTPKGILLEPWSPLSLATSADLIAAAYEGHIDSQINDQYQDAYGARRFLQNIVQYPGCGQFLRGASWLARERGTGGATGNLAGLVLASQVAPGVGHITQICVSPKWRGMGLGKALLERSLASLHTQGTREATLTVTEANENAVQLYTWLGFRQLRRFDAVVWEQFL